ncbi:MAG: hypothetical protein IPL38_03600 [Rhodobacter sp.]|nr:hypothetical protein [Rhodobacter sp.]MBK8438613.1 hypothetical protein [Rhodobacter sp.]
MAGLTLSVGALAGALMGAPVYLPAFLPIHDKPNFPVRSLIVTLAINLATMQILLWYFGPQQKNLPRIFGTGRVELHGRSARYDQIGTILGTALILALELVWLRISRKGLEIRAMIGAIRFLGQRYVLFGTFVFIIIVLIIRHRSIGGMLDKARK